MPCKIKTIVCAGARMDCAVIGDGPKPVLMIPGMSLHKVTPQSEAVAGAYKSFASDYTIYLLDRREKPDRGLSVSDMADDAAAALEQLGIAAAFVLGPSQGGMIAMELALRHPERVRGLALVSTIARQSETSRDTMRRWKELSALESPVELNRDVFRSVYSPEYFHRYEKAFSRLESIGTPEEMRSFGIMASATATFDIYDRIGGISCPVLVAGVQKDTVLGSEGTADIAGALHCRSIVYPGSGHAFYDETPSFPEIIKDFFDGED